MSYLATVNKRRTVTRSVPEASSDRVSIHATVESALTNPVATALATDLIFSVFYLIRFIALPYRV